MIGFTVDFEGIGKNVIFVTSGTKNNGFSWGNNSIKHYKVLVKSKREERVKNIFRNFSLLVRADPPHKKLMNQSQTLN